MRREPLLAVAVLLGGGLGYLVGATLQTPAPVTLPPEATAELVAIAERDRTIAELRAELETLRSDLAFRITEPPRPAIAPEPAVREPEASPENRKQEPPAAAAPGDSPLPTPTGIWAYAPFLEKLREEDLDRYRELLEQDPTTLESLNLRGLELSDDDLLWLQKLPALTDLDLRGSSIADASLPLLQSLRLTSLQLRGTSVTASGLQSLSHLRLKALHLTDTPVRGQDLAVLPTFPELEVLKLNFLSLGDEHLASLDRYPLLRHVEIDGTAVTGEGLRRFLEQHPSLQRVELRNTAVSMEDWQLLQERFPDCDLVLDPGIWSGGGFPNR